MSADLWRAERERLANLLEGYESGRIRHYDEGDAGLQRRETTAERIADLRRRIEKLDRDLAKYGGT